MSSDDGHLRRLRGRFFGALTLPGPPDQRGERSFREIVKNPEQSFAYLNIFKPQNLLVRDSGRADR